MTLVSARIFTTRCLSGLRHASTGGNILDLDITLSIQPDDVLIACTPPINAKEREN